MGKGNENIIFLIKYLFLLKKVIIFVPENVVIHPHRKRWGFLTENYIKTYIFAKEILKIYKHESKSKRN
jgi:hypothetical protein